MSLAAPACVCCSSEGLLICTTSWLCMGTLQMETTGGGFIELRIDSDLEGEWSWTAKWT